MWGWWWGWVALLVLLVLLPWSYGWSRRGWGPPYPTYYQRRAARRQGARETAGPGTPVRTPTGRGHRVEARERQPGASGNWSWLADLLWVGALLALGWAVFLWVS